MGLNVHIVLVTYAIDPTPLVMALQGEDVTWWVFHHSKRVDVADACYALQNSIPIHFYDYRQNRGLARSWNDGLEMAYGSNADVVLIVNDDLEMGRRDLTKLVEAAFLHPSAGIIVAEGYNARMGDQLDLGFSVFAVNRVAIDTVGYFDENFVPIYFEDSDYSRRAGLAGLPYHSVRSTGIIHTGSASQTIPELKAQNDVTFQANYRYYVAKWNGGPGQETYPVPFNDTHFGLKIDGHLRHAPYEGYNRTDIGEIVKL